MARRTVLYEASQALGLPAIHRIAEWDKSAAARARFFSQLDAAMSAIITAAAHGHEAAVLAEYDRRCAQRRRKDESWLTPDRRVRSLRQRTQCSVWAAADAFWLARRLSSI